MGELLNIFDLKQSNNPEAGSKFSPTVGFDKSAFIEQM